MKLTQVLDSERAGSEVTLCAQWLGDKRLSLVCSFCEMNMLLLFFRKLNEIRHVGATQCLEQWKDHKEMLVPSTPCPHSSLHSFIHSFTSIV